MTKRAIYYDTETTGVKPDKDKIIEIAAYDPLNDKTFCKLVNPGISIPKEASNIHHITDDMVQDVPDFSQIGQEFIEFCSGDVVLIAHNNDSFDKPFLMNEFGLVNISMPNWPFIDSLKWARKYRNDLPRHSLQFLREVYEIEANQAHRALDDVIILHQVFSYMIDDLSMETILELLSKKTVLKRMPFGKHQGKPIKDVPKNYVLWLASSGALDKKENHELRSTFEKAGLLEMEKA